jgi:hypothetical protein
MQEQTSPGCCADLLSVEDATAEQNWLGISSMPAAPSCSNYLEQQNNLL